MPYYMIKNNFTGTLFFRREPSDQALREYLERHDLDCHAGKVCSPNLFAHCTIYSADIPGNCDTPLTI